VQIPRSFCFLFTTPRRPLWPFHLSGGSHLEMATGGSSDILRPPVGPVTRPPNRIAPLRRASRCCGPHPPPPAAAARAGALGPRHPAAPRRAPPPPRRRPPPQRGCRPLPPPLCAPRTAAFTGVKRRDASSPPWGHCQGFCRTPTGVSTHAPNEYHLFSPAGGTRPTAPPLKGWWRRSTP